jgi:hypothetical protein
MYIASSIIYQSKIEKLSFFLLVASSRSDANSVKMFCVSWTTQVMTGAQRIRATPSLGISPPPL